MVAPSTTTAGPGPPGGAAVNGSAGVLGVHLQGRAVVWRSRRLGCSLRIQARVVAVTLVVLAVTALVFAWSLAVGDFPIPLGDVVATLLGGGNDDSAFIVRTLRLPRGLAGLLVGAAFGLSGAIFQRLTRNPLASPDIIGINAGATTGAVLVIVLWQGTAGQVAVGALIGAGLTAAALYVLSYRQGVSGYRLVLVGIGMTFMLTAVTDYMLTRAQIFEAERATVWITGNLNNSGWDQVRWVAVALVVVATVALAAGRRLRLLELGDEAAVALGIPVESTRALLIGAGAVLAAAGTSAAGPVAFVALLSPQIARRLVGARSLGLVAAAACGALLMVAADLVARRLFAPAQLPVGVVTAVLGAPYLLYLMTRANRIGSGG
jgi:iron complex transport system permease protein